MGLGRCMECGFPNASVDNSIPLRNITKLQLAAGQAEVCGRFLPTPATRPEREGDPGRQRNIRPSRSSSAGQCPQSGGWMRPNILFVVVLFALAALFLQVPPAGAHAVLVSSNPSAKGTVTGPDVSIELRFNVRVDGARSRLT